MSKSRLEKRIDKELKLGNYYEALARHARNQRNFKAAAEFTQLSWEAYNMAESCAAEYNSKYA